MEYKNFHFPVPLHPGPIAPGNARLRTLERRLKYRVSRGIRNSELCRQFIRCNRNLQQKQMKCGQTNAIPTRIAM